MRMFSSPASALLDADYKATVFCGLVAEFHVTWEKLGVEEGTIVASNRASNWALSLIFAVLEGT